MRPVTRYGSAYLTNKSIERLAAASDVNSLDAALQNLRRDTRTRHAVHMAANYSDGPRYAVAEDWGHYFSDSVPEFDTRWVFDRRRWCVAVLHIKRRSDTVWSMALQDEIADLDESLMDANAGALDLQMEEFGTRESEELPGWVNDVVIVERRSYVEAQA